MHLQAAEHAQHTTKPLARQTLRVILFGWAIALSKVSCPTTSLPQHGTRFGFNTQRAIALPNERASFKRLYRKGAGRGSRATPGAFPAARFRYSTNVFRSQSGLTDWQGCCQPDLIVSGVQEAPGCAKGAGRCFRKLCRSSLCPLYALPLLAPVGSILVRDLPRPANEVRYGLGEEQRKEIGASPLERANWGPDVTIERNRTELCGAVIPIE